MATSGPLSATLARLSRENPYRRLVVGEPGPGWIGWNDVLTDQGVLDGWYAQLLGEAAGGKPDVAGSFLVVALTGALVDVAAGTLLGEQRSFSLRAGDIAIHRDEGGWCDGLAIRSPAVRVLAGDPDADHPDATVLTPATLTHDTAVDLAALLDPAFDGIRARAPFGRSGMWGSVADHIGLVASRLVRSGTPGAWDHAGRLLEALGAAAPRLRALPSVLPVNWERGPSLFSIRGTCCLLYKVAAGADRRTGAGYCATCPLLDRGLHQTLLADWARREAPAPS